MKRALLGAGLFLVAASQPSLAAAQAQTGEAERVNSEALSAARTAVGAADIDRVLRDRTYAAELLRHLELLAGVAEIYSEAGRGIELMRLLSLVSLERNDEARATLDRIIAMRLDQPSDYAAPIYAALSIRDLARFAAVVEAASRNVRASGWGELRGMLERDSVWPALHQLRLNNPPARIRLAEALFRIGWRGSETDSGDGLRLILLTNAEDRGDRREARDYASGVTTPNILAPLLVLRRHDGLLAAGDDRLAPLREALAAQERSTAEALARNGDNLLARLDRIQHLRAVGRNTEALALAEAQLRDPVAAARASEYGMWIVNEAAYALLDLNRNEEAARALRGLITIPIEERNYLVSSLINHGAILAQAGRHAESLEHALRLERDFARHASDYGVMWIRATIVCALARIERPSEAASTLAQMRATESINPAALMRAYLCLNDLDAAERLMIARLESDDPEEAVMALQDYGLEAGRDALLDRLLAVRARSAVRAAFDRVARLVELPLARTYWGGF